MAARAVRKEEVHKVMKEDLAGGMLPSWDVGENGASWGIMMLSLALDAMTKRLVLGEVWSCKRMKPIRFYLICLPGRVV